MLDLNPYLDLLYARPSVLEGIARTLDLGDTLGEYNRSLTEEQADYLSDLADWNAVGFDLQDAIDTFIASHPQSCPNDRPTESR